ncbi:hypothetical protein CBS101457_000300 [Exobasidium rhododendri]|nr:hypothetical protein CBS101457_000300 [Exobasidium rhododendri]
MDHQWDERDTPYPSQPRERPPRQPVNRVDDGIIRTAVPRTVHALRRPATERVRRESGRRSRPSPDGALQSARADLLDFGYSHGQVEEASSGSGLQMAYAGSADSGTEDDASGRSDIRSSQPIPGTARFALLNTNAQYRHGEEHHHETGSQTSRVSGRFAQAGRSSRRSRAPEQQTYDHLHVQDYQLPEYPYQQPDQAEQLASELMHMNLYENHNINTFVEEYRQHQIVSGNASQGTLHSGHSSSSSAAEEMIREDDEFDAVTKALPRGGADDDIRVWRYLTPQDRREVVYSIFKHSGLGYLPTIERCKTSLNSPFANMLTSGNEKLIAKTVKRFLGLSPKDELTGPAWTQSLTSVESVKVVRYAASIRGESRDTIRETFQRFDFTEWMARSLLQAESSADRRVIAREIGLISY